MPNHEDPADRTAPPERRRSARTAVARPCKVLDRRSLRFSPGETADVSDGGALLRIDRGRPFAPGDELDVAVAWSHQPVLADSSLVRAVVRRVTVIDDAHQAIGVEFVAPQSARRAA
ncbi:MAG: PilZ domain-containing protein [Phycisphaerales bacterium]|nr:PilZ domain-containing protein [Phycisphaerales bacterium]